VAETTQTPSTPTPKTRAPDNQPPNAAASLAPGSFDLFDRLRSDMLAMTESFWRGAPAAGFALPGLGPLRWADPAIDMSETDEGYVLSAQLPGLQKSDVAVEVEDHILSISGAKEDVCKGKRKHHPYAERRFGAFRRTVALPRDADPSGVEARCVDGVLTVTIPRATGARAVKAVTVK